MPPTTRAGSRPVAAVVVVVALAIALTVAACAAWPAQLPTAVAGSAASGSGSSSAASAAVPSPSGVSSDPAVAWPAFAGCLRAHGLDVPDPALGSDGQPQFPAGLDLKTLITPAMDHDCSPILAAITASKGQSSHSYTFESLVAHAACLRAHGLTSYPDPNPNDPPQLAPGYLKSDPTVNAALVACQGTLVDAAASPSPGR